MKTSETIDKTNEQASSSVESNESVKNEEPTADGNNSQLTVADLDTAINAGDFTTLVGIWKNGKGESLIIHPDGSTNTGGMITKDSPTDESRPITSLSIRWGLLVLRYYYIKLVLKILTATNRIRRNRDC